MFEINKTFRFEAGHVLTKHNGKCSKPHGHSYVLVVKLQTDTLISSGPQTNMVLDFKEFKDIVKPMIDQFLDHQWLNDTLDTDSPTVEFIARWIYKHLKPHLPALSTITVHETASSKATYYEQ